MFTGLVEELGEIRLFEPTPGGIRIAVRAPFVCSDSRNGDSIAVNGVCLTALDVTMDGFAAELSGETLDRTTLGTLAVGTRVNLERAVTPATRLGGHIVQGHVDGRGELASVGSDGEFRTIAIRFPRELAKYLIYKGSIAVDGISLTIASLEDELFRVAVIPKTWQATNLSTLRPGHPVNLEVDLIAKYVERILDARSAV